MTPLKHYCQTLLITDGRQVGDLQVISFDGWCKDRKPKTITRIWFGENLSGYLTNIQVFSRLLSNEEMHDITTCKLFLPGDYISWQTQRWITNPFAKNKTTQIREIRQQNLNYADICKPTENWQMLFTHGTADNRFQWTGRPFTPAQWEHNKKWCATLKARQIAVLTHEDRQKFKDFLDDTFSKSNATKHKCVKENEHGVLNGWFQVAHRKATGPHSLNPYKDEYTGEVVNLTSDDWHLPPSPNSVEPNFYNNFWQQISYDSLKFMERTLSGSCHTCVGKQPLIPWINIRGLCRKSKFDKRYMIGDDNATGIYFQGEFHTNITKDKDSRPTKLIMLHTALEKNHTIKVTRAETVSNYGTFLLGRRSLRIEEDKNCEPTKTNFTLDVIFSTCMDDEFTCDDGICIEMTKHCDNINNCPNDISDEVECKLLIIPSTYKKAYAPIKMKGRDTVIKVNVTVSMDVSNILRISETQEIFESKLTLHLQWYDNRIQYNNLKLGKKNMMEREEQRKIWTPPAFFENTKNSDKIVNDHHATAFVTRSGHFELLGKDVLYNTEVFKGDENSITLSRLYRKEFICVYQIAMYPFDTQRCKIIISLGGNADEFIDLLPGNLDYLGPEDLTIYFIKQTAIHRGSSNKKRVVYVEVTLGRRLLSTVLTVYLPTILLNIIGFSTNFFKVDWN